MQQKSPANRGTWATLVQRTREAAGLPKVELARRLGVDRGTIGRWESGTTRPENLEVVQRFGELFALNLKSVLVAAGMSPDSDEVTPPPPEPRDPDIRRLIELFEDPTTSAEVKDAARTALRAVMDMAERQPKAPRRRTRKAAS